jgi:hypothetical protein
MIQIQSNVPTISQRIQRIADSLATVISGGINEAAEMEVQQTNENITNLLDLRRVEFYELTGFTPSNPKKLECKILVDERKTVEVAAFDLRQTSQGVEVYMYRFQPPFLYEKAFGPNQRSLSRGVYYRVTKRRFPIRKIKSINLANQEPIQNEIKAGRNRIPESLIIKMQSNFRGLLQ